MHSIGKKGLLCLRWTIYSLLDHKVITKAFSRTLCKAGPCMCLKAKTNLILTGKGRFKYVLLDYVIVSIQMPVYMRQDYKCAAHILRI